MKLIARLTLIASTAFVASAAVAQDDVAARKAAVDRYLAVVPMSTMLEDTFSELAKQLPENQRADFISKMRSLVRADRVERIARDAMLRVFTADELNALADFYGSKHGSSAMKKFGVYMAELLPAVRAEMERAIREMKASRAAPSG